MSYKVVFELDGNKIRVMPITKTGGFYDVDVAEWPAIIIKEYFLYGVKQKLADSLASHTQNPKGGARLSDEEFFSQGRRILDDLMKKNVAGVWSDSKRTATDPLTATINQVLARRIQGWNEAPERDREKWRDAIRNPQSERAKEVRAEVDAILKQRRKPKLDPDDLLD